MLFMLGKDEKDRAGGVMNELIDRLVASAGIDRAQAEQAIGIILDFLLKEGPTDRVQALISALPGASDAIAAQQAPAGAGNFLTGMGGVMGAANRLMGVGLSMGQVQTVTRELVAHARETVGEDAVEEIVDAIPGLAPFV
jgi:hypothetical protein